MDDNRSVWINWSRLLHRWGISDGVASILDGTGSLSLLAAQVLYLGQPLLSGLVSSHSLQAMAQVLENPDLKKEFVTFLREAPSCGSGD